MIVDGNVEVGVKFEGNSSTYFCTKSFSQDTKLGDFAILVYGSDLVLANVEVAFVAGI